MLVPRPPSTCGTLSRPKYTRRPGRLTRWMPVMTRSPRGPYFSGNPDQLPGQPGVRGLVHDLEALDIALVGQDARDLGLQLRRGHVDACVLGGNGITNAREHV